MSHDVTRNWSFWSWKLAFVSWSPSCCRKVLAGAGITSHVPWLEWCLLRYYYHLVSNWQCCRDHDTTIIIMFLLLIIITIISVNIVFILTQHIHEHTTLLSKLNKRNVCHAAICLTKHHLDVGGFTTWPQVDASAYSTYRYISDWAKPVQLCCHKSRGT